MRSSQNVMMKKIPFRSSVMAFLIIAYCFVPMGKGVCDWETVVQYIIYGGTQLTQRYWGSIDVTHDHEQTIFAKEIHTLITFMVSVMASNTVDGL